MKDEAKYTEEEMDKFALGFVQWYIDLAENKSKYIAFKMKCVGVIKGSDFINAYKSTLPSPPKPKP